MEEQKTITNQEPQQTEEKRFSQADVDRIVKERLARQKDSHEKEVDSKNKAKAEELEEKEKELNCRESRISCREYLIEEGYPDELLDIFDTNDRKTFESKVKEAASIFAKLRRRNVAPLASTEGELGEDREVAKAFRKPEHRVKMQGAPVRRYSGTNKIIED